MGGLRKKDMKPTKTNDFKKVKKKVGKKLSRGNETKITVKAKKIVLSSQKALEAQTHDELTRLGELSKQLHHHSASSRLSALNTVRDILEKSDQAGSFVAMILPSALETLFDEQKEARASLIRLVDGMMRKYHWRAFESVSSIISTYCCSGLTNLKKEIRHDALAVLSLFLDRGKSPILALENIKLLQHVSNLLSLSSHGNSIKASHVVKQGTDGQKLQKPSSFLIMTLEVLDSLLRLSSPEVSVISRFSLQMETFDTSEVMFIYPFSKNINSIRSVAESSASAGDKLDKAAVLNEICLKMLPIWSGLVHEGSVVAAQYLSPLYSICCVCKVLSHILPGLISSDKTNHTTLMLKATYSKLISNLFVGFPYSLNEVESSELFDSSDCSPSILNITIVEATLMWLQNLHGYAMGQSVASNEQQKDAIDGIACECTLHINRSLSALNASLGDDSSSPCDTRSTIWKNMCQSLFHCVSLEVQLVSCELFGLRGDNVTFDYILGGFCQFIGKSVDLLSNLHARTSDEGLFCTLKSALSCILEVIEYEHLWNISPENISKLLKVLTVLPSEMAKIHQVFVNKALGCEEVIGMALSVTLSLLQRCSLIGDCSDQISIAADGLISSAVAEVGNRMSCLFDASDDDDDDESKEVVAIYSLYSNSLRLQVLDILFYCSFECFSDVAAKALVAIAGGVSESKSIEEDKFLYLLQTRRNEMEVTEFVACLLQGLESSANSILCNELLLNVESQTSPESKAIQQNKVGKLENLQVLAGRVTSSDWFASKIGNVLFQCSSNSAPYAMTTLCLPPFQCMISEVKNDAQDLEVFYYSIACFTILKVLFSPYRLDHDSFGMPQILDDCVVNVSSPMLDAPDKAFKSAVNFIADSLLTLVSYGADSVLSEIFRKGFLELRNGCKYESSILYPIMSTMSCRWCRTVEGSTISYDVLLCLLKKIETKLATSGEAFHMSSVIEHLFGVIQYWRLSDCVIFKNYQTAISEQVESWLSKIDKNVGNKTVIDKLEELLTLASDE